MSIEIRNKEPKTYVVFGVPHSATSFISKALEEQGVDMGNDMEGLYQNYDMFSSNEKMIRNAGGYWWDPPSEEEIIKNTVSNIEKKIERNKAKFWGFKDPRTSLTAKAWFPYLDGDVYLICCFRKPEKVVESYKDSDSRVNRELIDHYNKSIISAIKEFVGLG